MNRPLVERASNCDDQMKIGEQMVQRSAGTYKVRYMPDGRILLDPKGPLLMTFSTPINTMEDMLILPTSQAAQDPPSDQLSSQTLASPTLKTKVFRDILKPFCASLICTAEQSQ